MLRILVLLPALFLACPSPAAEVLVRATREGDELRVRASAEVDGDLQHTWKVLTDYEHLPEFIPGMTESRVVGRGPRGPVLEQRGEARLLFLTYALNVRLAVEEHPYERITARAVSGNFRQMEGVYLLEARAGHVKLSYAGVLVPDFFVPPLIGTFILRLNVERQFRALVEEIARRQALPGREGSP